MITIEIPNFWAYIFSGLFLLNMVLVTVNFIIRYKIRKLDIFIKQTIDERHK